MATTTNVSIVQGEDRTFSLYLRQKENPSQPIDLTGITAASLKMPNADGSTQLTLGIGTGLTVASEAGGKMTVQVNDTQSALLNVGLLQDCELTYDKGAERRIVPLLRFLTVSARVFG